MANGSNMFSVYCRLFLHFPGELFVLAKRDTEVPSLKTYLQLKISPFIFFHFPAAVSYILFNNAGFRCSFFVPYSSYWITFESNDDSHICLTFSHDPYIYENIGGGGRLFSHKVNASDENILALPLYPDLCWIWMGFSLVHAPSLHQISWNPLTSFCFMHNQ